MSHTISNALNHTLNQGSRRPIRRVVILGGGTSGWISAAMLAAQFKPELCHISLIEAEDIATIGVGESTIPPMVQLLHRLGVDEQEFIRETQACYKLGIQFVDWRKQQQRFFHPYGSLGAGIGGYDFYQCWLKASLCGEHYPLGDFSPCAVMAAQQRFYPPDQAQSTPIGGAQYAVHFDAQRVASYLRRYSVARGVAAIAGKCERVERDERGFIAALHLADGRRVEGDFFIDCSGFRSLLLGDALGVEFEDWSHWLPCDRAIAVKTEASANRLPYTTAHARKVGWSWRIPQRDGTGQGYVYASRFCSDAEAKSTLLRNLGAPRISEPKLISFTPGHRHQLWHHNCVAIGLAGGFVEPLESTAIHLIVRGIDTLLRFFPDAHCEPSLALAYNRRMQRDYDEIRDFIVLHYCTSERSDSEFWRWCQQMPVPDSLQERIALFRAQGLVLESGDDIFRSSSWQAVFEGMGVRPAGYCPRVDNLDYPHISASLQRARSAIRNMVDSLPSHDEYLARQYPES